MFEIKSQFDKDFHEFRTVAPSVTEWRELLADRYVELRSAMTVPVDPELFDGLQFDTSQLKSIVENAVVPTRSGGPLCIIRSDFGETIGVLYCEQIYGTRFGWIGLRDRALNQQPGGGIDSVGVEIEGSSIRLVLLEVKVSTEDKRPKPPRVVEPKKDGLRVQHLKNIKDCMNGSVSKIVRAASAARDVTTSAHLLVAAAKLTDATQRDEIRVVCVSVLIRPEEIFDVCDFGSFRSSPSDYSPAVLRFIVPTFKNDLEKEVDDWYAEVLKRAGGDE